MTLLLKETTEARILRIADSLQPEIRRTFLGAITELKRSVPIGQITNLLEEGKLSATLEALSQVALTPQQLAPINDAILQTVTLSAELTAAEFGLDFSLVNERAVRYATETAGRLIVGIDSTTTEAVADIVSRGLREGIAPRSQARLIQQIVGLTPRDALAVDRFKTGMLRDGIRESLAGDRAERMATRLLRRRAENIARTETIRAANMGTQFGWDAAQDAGLLPQGTQKVWIATEDSRTCPICAVLDGNTVELGGNFDVSEEATAFTIEGQEIRVTATRPMKRPSTTRTPPAHPSCRCTMGVELVEGVTVQEPVIRPSKTFTNEQIAAFDDLASGRYNPETFDRMREVLSQTDEGKSLFEFLDKWQGSETSGRFRSQIDKFLAGELEGPAARRIQSLFDAMSEIRVVAPESLHRGMAVRGKIENILSKYKTGDVLDLNLSSFTADTSTATRYARQRAQNIPVVNKTEILVEWVGTKKGAIPLQNLARDSFHLKQKEWIGGGRFRIIEVRKARGGIKIIIEQEAVLGA